MMGFKKNKTQNKTDEPKAEKSKTEPQVHVEAVKLNDDQVTVMPKQYLNEEPGKSSFKGKKIFILATGVVFVLLIVSAALYFLLLADKISNTDTPVDDPTTSPTDTIPNDNPPDNTPPDNSTIEDNIISVQALDDSEQVKGSLVMIVPASLVETAGDSIGVTILDENEIEFPEDTEIVGGIYALYPVAQNFDESINFELSIESLKTNMGEDVLFENVKLVTLRGTLWRDIVVTSTTTDSFMFSLDEFPSGPITSIYIASIDDGATTTPDIAPTDVAHTIDTDQDGLTDIEENLIGTSVDLTDTDEDTYSDFDEIWSGFSPLVAGGEKSDLIEFFATYTNPTYGYSVQYPTKWLANSLDQTNQQVLFISDTEEFMEILIEENPLDVPIVDWYRAQSPALEDISLDVLIIDGRPAVWSPDHLTLYVSKDGIVYILTYNKGTLDAINWPTMFQYFYTKFTFGETSNGEENNGDLSVVSCGTTGDVITDSSGDTLVYSTDDITKTTFDCFADAVSTCSLATMTADTYGQTDEYTILGESEGSCSISGPVIDTSGFVQTIENSTCDVDNAYIDSMFEQATSIYPADSYIRGYNLGLALLFVNSEAELASFPGFDNLNGTIACK